MLRRYLLLTLSLIYIFGLSGCTSQNSSQVMTSSNDNSIFYNKQTDNIKEDDSSSIAILFSSKAIGKYAINATNSAMSYLIYKNNNFNLRVFDCVLEDEKSIKNAFTKIANTNIKKIIILFTYNGAIHLKKIDNIESYSIYMPLIHKNSLNLNIKSVVYGSINYAQQFEQLLKYSTNKIVHYYDNTALGTKLKENLESQKIHISSQRKITNDNSKYRRFLTNKNKKLEYSTLIVNMPIVKSSIILSQINANEVLLSNILSTQLNYTPLLLSLTQVQDRKNMIIANSIGETNDIIEEYNALLDNDITYNWVNYSTILGVEYLINNNLNIFTNINIQDNQVQYPVNLYSTSKYAFQHLN